MSSQIYCAVLIAIYSIRNTFLLALVAS